MKKQKLSLLLLLAMLSISQWLQAQSSTDIELHNRYWTYRENFSKYFTVISKEPGGGLPFSDLKTNHSPYFNVVDAQGNNISGNVDLAGQINVGGDVTAFMAEYMSAESAPRLEADSAAGRCRTQWRTERSEPGRRGT